MDSQIIYVVGMFDGGSGHFEWFRSAFDAGVYYERTRREIEESNDPLTSVYYKPLLVPKGLKGEDVTDHIDGLLAQLETDADT